MDSGIHMVEVGVWLCGCDFDAPKTSAYHNVNSEDYL